MAGMWEYLNGETMQKLKDQNQERDLIDARHSAEMARRDRLREASDADVSIRAKQDQMRKEAEAAQSRLNPPSAKQPVRGGGGMSGGQGEMGMMARGSMGDDTQGLSADPQSVSKPSPPEKTGAVGAAMDVIQSAAALNRPPSSPAIEANRAATDAVKQELRKYSRDGIPEGLDRASELKNLGALIRGEIQGRTATANDIDNYITLQVAEQTAAARANMGASEVGREATKEVPSAQPASTSVESSSQQGSSDDVVGGGRQAPSRPAPTRTRTVEGAQATPPRSGNVERDRPAGPGVSAELEGLRNMGVRGALGGVAASNVRPGAPKPTSAKPTGAAQPPVADRSYDNVEAARSRQTSSRTPAEQGPSEGAKMLTKASQAKAVAEGKPGLQGRDSSFPSSPQEAFSRQYFQDEGEKSKKKATQELRSGNPDPSNFQGMGSPNETGYKVPMARASQAARSGRPSPVFNEASPNLSSPAYSRQPLTKKGEIVPPAEVSDRMWAAEQGREATRRASAKKKDKKELASRKGKK